MNLIFPNILSAELLKLFFLRDNAKMSFKNWALLCC